MLWPANWPVPAIAAGEALNRVLNARPGVLTFEGRESRGRPRCRAVDPNLPPAGTRQARVRLVAVSVVDMVEFSCPGQNRLATFKPVSGVRGPPLNGDAPSQAPHLWARAEAGCSEG